MFCLETRTDLDASEVELAWLIRDPLCYKVIFIAKFKNMMINDYRIPINFISVRNPQANSIVERIHQTIGDTIRDLKMQQIDLNLWEEEVLLSTIFAIRSTVHTTKQHTLSQLVFGKDAILNINQEANWQLI